MITVSVDMNACQNYGQCCFEAADVFQLDDDGQLVFQSQASDNRRDELEQAADVCPMQAISLTFS